MNPFAFDQAKAGSAERKPSRSWIVLIVFGVCLAAGFAVVVWRGLAASAAERRQTRAEAEIVANSLEQQLGRAMAAADVMAALVRQGNGLLPGFPQIGAEILQAHPGVASLSLQPSGVTSDVVPRAGNERSIGFNVLNHPSSRTPALAAYNTRRLVISGPFAYPGGGVAVIGRLPVYVRDRAGREQWWGFVSVAVRLDHLVGRARVSGLSGLGYHYSLYTPDGALQNRAVIAASARPPARGACQQIIRVQNFDLRLALSPVASPWLSQGMLAAAGTALVVAGLFAALAALLRKRRDARRALEAAEAGRSVANERFDTLLESMPDAVAAIDSSGRIQAVSARTEALFGWKRDEMLGQPVEMLLPERLRKRHPTERVRFFQMPSSRPMGAGRELAGLRKDGSEFPIEVFLSSLPGADAKEGLACGAIRDVSELRRLEANAASLLKELRNTAATAQSGGARLKELEERLRLNEESQRHFKENAESLAARLKEATEQFHGIEEQSRQHEGKAQELQANLKKAELEWRASEERGRMLNETAEALTVRVAGLEKQTEDAGKENTRLKEKLEKAAGKLSETEQRLAAAHQDNQRLSEEIQSLQAEAEQLRTGLAAARLAAAEQEKLASRPVIVTTADGSTEDDLQPHADAGDEEDAIPPEAHPAQSEPEAAADEIAQSPAETAEPAVGAGSQPEASPLTPEAATTPATLPEQDQPAKPALTTEPPAPAPQPKPPRKKKAKRDDQLSLFGDDSGAAEAPPAAVPEPAVSQDGTVPGEPPVSLSKPSKDSEDAIEEENTIPPMEEEKDAEETPHVHAGSVEETKPAPPSAADLGLPATDDLDTTRGLLNADGDRKQYLKTLRHFVEHNAVAAEVIRDLLVQGNTDRGEQVCQDLETAADKVGAGTIQIAAARLARAIQADADPSGIESLWGDLDKALAGLMAELKPVFRPAPDKPAHRPPPPVNAPLLRKAVNQILPLLMGQDPGAKDCLKANRDTFRSAFAPETYTDFEKHVKGSDFNEALELLKKAAKKHGVL